MRVFKTFKLKKLIILLSCLMIMFALSFGIVSVVQNESIPKPQYTIVLDAGHGGRDGGCSSPTGIKESDINLAIARTLSQYLQSYGINIVLTRNDENGLYKANADNYKLSDMKERMAIIEKTSPNLVISIHQNSFPDTTLRGAQAFYQKNDQNSEDFAKCVQQQLTSQLPHAKQSYNHGDYYLLKNCDVPAIIIECGYLSNEEDTILLSSNTYQNQLAYAIMCGVIKYINYP